MVALDAWNESGIGAVARSYFDYCAREQGLRRDIDDNGDLLLRRVTSARRRAQAAAAAPCRTVLVRSRHQGAVRMKLLRTIRLDPSDTFVFEPVAEPGEWAVSGAFAFWNGDPSKLEGKARTAFRSGFLSAESLGWSTLVQIVEASDADRANLVELLAQKLIGNFGAPDLQAAAAAAEDEVSFVESLCTQPHDTLIAVHRSFEDGNVREVVPHAAPARGCKACARLLLHGGRGRGRGAGRGGGFDLLGRKGA